MPIYKDVIIDQHGKELYIRGLSGYGCSICLESCKETIDWYLNRGYFVYDGRLMQDHPSNEKFKPKSKRTYSK
jgi:hypothetical protein